ncbi:MAG: hypothetical protein KF870_14395 [Leadbetterella sp.]|nr:hypothetical protein [Leadbetterella sp.]
MNKLDKILRETPLTDRPAADFSSAVMKSVHSEAELDAVRAASLEQLLQRLPADTASAAFSEKVMQKISVSAEPRPLLGLWGRVAIAAFALMFWVTGHYFSSSEAFFGPATRQLFAIPSVGISPVYALSILGMGLLLLLDYVLRQRKTGEG